MECLGFFTIRNKLNLGRKLTLGKHDARCFTDEDCKEIRQMLTRCYNENWCDDREECQQCADLDNDLTKHFPPESWHDKALSYGMDTSGQWMAATVHSTRYKLRLPTIMEVI